MILIPAIEWKIGKPNQKIRKASIICIMKTVQQQIIGKEKFIDHFTGILTVLKNCLDDDWANDVRFSAVCLLKYIVEYCGPLFTEDMNKELYEQLLKRLDDSQDGIRIETCKVFEHFFDSLQNEWSSSLYDYTIKQIFVHLDDGNENVRKAVAEVLKKASRIRTSTFLKIAGDAAAMGQHHSAYKEVGDWVLANRQV